MIAAAKDKLDKIIQESRTSVPRALVSIQKEYEARVDVIARPAVIDYEVSPAGVLVNLKGDPYTLTNHSEGQLYSRLGIPSTYAKKLQSLGEVDLLENNLRKLTHRVAGEGMLIRRVGNSIKGILSPSYRMMDASPIFESYIENALKLGFVPYRGSNTDFRYQIIFIFPEVFQLGENEYLVYGLSLTTGDYGTQALQVEFIALRISCTNLHIGYDLFRKVHLGKRFDLGGEDFVEFSEQTHRLDTSTIASAVSDVVTYGANHIGQLHEVMAKRANEGVDVQKALKALRDKGVISKEVAERVQVTYDTDLPLEALPKEKNLWRFTNALSLVSQSMVDTPDKKIDMEKQAMSLLIGTEKI